MRELVNELARRAGNMMSPRKSLVPILFGIMLLCTSVQAASVTNVSVEDTSDRIVVYATVQGDRVEAWTNQSSIGEFITLDIRGSYNTRPVRQAVRSQNIKAVRAGWFQSSPPVTRISISTAARVPFELERVQQDKLKLTVWKSRSARDAAQQAANDIETGPVDVAIKPVPTTPAAVSAAVVSDGESKALNLAGGPTSSTITVSAAPPAPVFSVSQNGSAKLESSADQVALAQPARPLRDFSAFRPEPRPAAVEPEDVVAAVSESDIEEPVTRVAGATEVLDALADLMADASVSIEDVKIVEKGSQGSDMPVAETKVARLPLNATQPTPVRNDQLVSLNFVGSDINDVLKALTMQAGVNVITATDVQGDVTVSLQNVGFESALDSITKLSGYRWLRDGNTYYVASDASIINFQTKTDAHTEVIAFNRVPAQDMVNVLKVQYPSLSVTVPSQKSDPKSVILSGSRESIEGARILIAQIDSSFSADTTETVTEIYNIRYARASSLVSTVRRLIPTVAVATGSVPAEMRLEPPDTKRGILWTLGKADDSSSGGSQDSGPGGGEMTAGPAIVEEPDSRMLVLTGTPADIRKALDLLTKVDVPLPQVMIEAKVVDLTMDDDMKQGFLYDQSLGGFNFGVIGPVDSLRTVRTLDLGLLSNLEAQIKKGEAQLLANPRISVVEGEVATIFIGDMITYIQSIQATTSGITVTTDKVNAGVEVGVLPLVSREDGTITLRIHPEASTPTLVVDQRTGVTLPQVSTRYANSTIRVMDGQTVVIGGLINHREMETLTRIPFLSDLPFLGQLFRHRERRDEQRELVIFITCTILQDN